jgi:hypothetical protein
VGCKLPYAEVELSLPAQARIVGTVDLEVRSFATRTDPHVPADLARRARPGALNAPRSILQLLRDGRRKINLPLLKVSALSHEIANYMGDERYSISASSLSDYEASDRPPRHIQKIASLCAIYGLQFDEFLRVLGIGIETCGSEPMPEQFMPGRLDHSAGPHNVPINPESPLRRLQMELADLPLLLRRSLDYISGLPRVSLEDFFWMGNQSDPRHPLLVGAVIAIVNRRKKKPARVLSNLCCYEPSLFLLLRRDGAYVCGPTTLEHGFLTIHGYPQRLHRPVQLRNQDEAEVVGQVVALARAIPS